MALTNVYATNYKAALITSPPTNHPVGEHGGVVRLLRDKFVFDADGAASETIYLGRLPANAMVISARVFGPDLGGTGTFELGNSASVDGSATDAADVDSFIDAGDSSGQAFDVSDQDSAQRGPSIGITKFAREVDVILTLTGVTSGATAKIIYVELLYVID